jgi:hypothetical protein
MEVVKGKRKRNQSRHESGTCNEIENSHQKIGCGIWIAAGQSIGHLRHHAKKEEFKHFAMDLEWPLRAKPQWREITQRVLFTGEIVEHSEEAEEKAD